MRRFYIIIVFLLFFSVLLLYGISIIPYNWVGSEGCRHPSDGVTAERCDEKEHFAASEGRSPMNKFRGAERRGNLLSLSYAAEDKKDTRHYPPPEGYRMSSQGTQASKPILPPTVPSGSFGISPTPSPHISSPGVTSTPISLPSYTTPGFPQTHIPTLPSAPAHIPTHILTPTVPIHTEMSQAPIIGNAIGEVLNKGIDKKGVLWLEVRDLLFDQPVKIKVINLKNTPIVKQTAIIRFEDIKIGDSVNVIFSIEGENNIASFISILTEEELKMMQGEGAGQIVASEEPDKSDNSTASE